MRPSIELFALQNKIRICYHLDEELIEVKNASKSVFYKSEKITVGTLRTDFDIPYQYPNEKN